MKKTVIITGGTRGIGKAAGRLFAEKGWNVLLTYVKNRDAAEICKRELGDSVQVIQADVRSQADCQLAAATAMEKFGRIDVLVNNAGIAGQQLVVDMKEDEWCDMLNVNCSGAFRMTKEVLPYLLEGEQKAIVNVSSMWGITGASCEVHYSAAKAGLIGFTKALAKELGPSGIRVNGVAPGVIDTDMNAEISQEDMEALAQKTPLCRIGKPDEVASAIYFLSCEDSSFITGQILSVDGGFVI